MPHTDTNKNHNDIKNPGKPQKQKLPPDNQAINGIFIKNVCLGQKCFELDASDQEVGYRIYIPANGS